MNEESVNMNGYFLSKLIDLCFSIAYVSNNSEIMIS